MSILVIDNPTESVAIPDAKCTTSQWRGVAGPAAITIDDDIDVIVFFDCQPRQIVAGAHVADGHRIRSFIENGGIFVAFVAEPDGYRLANLIAAEVQVNAEPAHSQPIRNFTPLEGPYLDWFSRYASLLNSSPAVSLPEGLEPQTLARHRVSNLPVAQLARVQSGLVVILPAPGDPGPPVADAIEIARSIIEPASDRWLDQPNYWLPQLRVLKDEESEIRDRYTSALLEVNRRQQEVMDTFQNPAAELLTQTSHALTAAVIWALSHLGVTALDVDAIRQPPKEEDLWLAVGPLEADTAPTKATHLAEVKGLKGTCRDDDLGALVRYLHRRTGEWSRTDLRGLLIVNHMIHRSPTDRQPAFSARQIEDSERDRVGLLPTTTLFELLRRRFAGDLSLTDAQERLLARPGLITIGV